MGDNSPNLVTLDDINATRRALFHETLARGWRGWGGFLSACGCNSVRYEAIDQGCQMVYFKTKSSNLSIFWRALEWLMFVIVYGRLE
jgi:hypothetical protein